MSDNSHNENVTEDVEEESWSLITEPGEINEGEINEGEINKEFHSLRRSRSTFKIKKTISQSKLFGRSRSFASEKYSVNTKSFSSKTKTVLSTRTHLNSDTAKSRDDLFVHTGDLHLKSRYLP